MKFPQTAEGMYALALRMIRVAAEKALENPATYEFALGAILGITDEAFDQFPYDPSQDSLSGVEP